MSEKKMTAEHIRAAIRKRYSDSRQYAVAEEVGLTTGYSHRRIDMVIVDCYGSNGFRIDGIEIKISTGDLRRELQDPEKHVSFFDKIDYFTLAVPQGVAEPLIDSIPQKWGILIVNEDGTTRYKRRPLALEDKKNDGDVPRGFMAELIRSIQKRQPAEQELRDAYNNGFEEGKKTEKLTSDYMNERVKREVEKLKAYDDMVSRFRLWGYADKMNEILDEFEAFRNLETDCLKLSIDRTIKMLEKFREKTFAGGGEE